MKESFGQRLARFRKEKNLTQEEVGNKMNVSGQAVSKWENDISYPDVSVLIDLSELLGVTLDDLLGKEKPQTTVILPTEERKDINQLMLKVIIDSKDGDKVRVNLPVALIKICVEAGIAMPQVGNNEALKNIDLNQIIALIEQGVMGKIVEIESKDGDTVLVIVE